MKSLVGGHIRGHHDNNRFPNVYFNHLYLFSIYVS